MSEASKGYVAAASGDDAPVAPGGNVIPAFADGKGAAPREGTASPASMPAPRADRSIGAILVDAGRLSVEDAGRVLHLQREKGLRFGDAAKALQVLTQADIEFALSRQFDYPYLVRGTSKVSESVVAAYDPRRPQLEVLRSLRSQLMLRWFDGDPARHALAVISAARGEGRSFIVANLAVVFSQLGERTLVVDADLRRPVQHALFGVDNRVGLSAVLSGRAGPEVIHRVPSLLNLAVLAAGVLPPNPQDLLARPLFTHLLQHLAAHYDVILIDSPPAAESADAQSIVLHAGAAVIVARRNSTRGWRVQGVSDSLAQAKVTLVGSVLNDF